MNVQRNKKFVMKLGVQRIPSIQFYDADGAISSTFGIVPSRVNTVLKKKLGEFVESEVDINTGILKKYTDEQIDVLETAASDDQHHAGGMTSYLDTLTTNSATGGTGMTSYLDSIGGKAHFGF